MELSSVQFNRSVVSNSLRPHGLHHARLPCPSPTPRACSNSCPSSQWCHPTISSSVVPFSSHLQSFPASGSLQISQFFASGGQSIGASALASVLLMNNQDWFPLELTGLIALLSKWNRNLSCCSWSRRMNFMNCSTSGFPVLHHLPELAQTHVHWVGDTNQPSHPLSSPSSAFSISQHQNLFQWVGSLHQVAKVLELQLQSPGR